MSTIKTFQHDAEKVRELLEQVARDRRMDVDSARPRIHVAVLEYGPGCHKQRHLRFSAISVSVRSCSGGIL